MLRSFSALEPPEIEQGKAERTWVGDREGTMWRERKGERERRERETLKGVRRTRCFFPVLK